MSVNGTRNQMFPGALTETDRQKIGMWTTIHQGLCNPWARHYELSRFLFVLLFHKDDLNQSHKSPSLGSRLYAPINTLSCSCGSY